MRETVVFRDVGAERAIEEAITFLKDRGLAPDGQTPYSAWLTAGAQYAAVPVQLRPQWCRVWVTVHDGAPAPLVDAAGVYIDANRARSRQIEAEVKALESEVYSESSWHEREQALRASLVSAGTSREAIDAKIALLKQRWLALGRKATAPSEEHLSA